MDDAKEDVIGWSVLELMGHRRITGYLRPIEIAGEGFIRVDVAGPATKDENGPWAATQFYRPSAVYCITPTTQESVLRESRAVAPPVYRCELPSYDDEEDSDDGPCF